MGQARGLRRARCRAAFSVAGCSSQWVPRRRYYRCPCSFWARSAPDPPGSGLPEMPSMQHGKGRAERIKGGAQQGRVLRTLLRRRMWYVA